MPFPEGSTRRSLICTRTVRVEDCERKDGRYGIEGRPAEVKPTAIRPASRQVSAGEAVRRHCPQWYRDAKTGTEP